VEIIPDFDTSSSLTLMKDIVKHYNLINQSIRSAQVQQIIRELVLQEGDRDFLPGLDRLFRLNLDRLNLEVARWRSSTKAERHLVRFKTKRSLFSIFYKRNIQE